MNVALPALLVFVLLLPGFAARSRFKHVERTSIDFSPFGEKVMEAVFVACALHAVWLSIGYLCLGRVLEVEALMALASSDAGAQAKAIQAIVASQHWIALYFGSLLATVWLLPSALRRWITRKHLDRRSHWLSRWLRFHEAPWYYLLTGADFELDKVPDFIVVSAIVDTKGEGPTLYTGVLDEYFVTPDGTLDRLVLENVLRRPLKSDRAERGNAEIERFYEIEGDYFVLRYDEAITLNIKYFMLEDYASRFITVAASATPGQDAPETSAAER
jgi:hypothetical protein